MNPSDATEEYAGRETATMPHGVDNANSLSETSSLNSKHVRRMSSIADHRAQKAQAVSKREANAAPNPDDHGIDTSNLNSRYIPWNRQDDHPQTVKFEGNAVSTAKYDRFFITFIFKFLFEMFSRVAYVYFLFQAGLSWWDEVSPFAGYGATLALTFVLLAAAIKAIVEDKKRQAEDHKTNNSLTNVMKKDADGKWKEHECRWSEVKVGDVVKVFDNDLFPADLMCVHCELPERICYVKTTNLDGETNLKVKRQVLDAEDYPDSPDPEAVLDLMLEVECEMPNSNLHNFRGRASIRQAPGDPGKILPITMNQMLLRGCMLKNSYSVLGLVVYTGKDTRIQMNSASAPLKIGSFDHFLNMQVAILIMAQVGLCIICAVLNYNWRETEGKRRYYLDFESYTQGNKENGLLYTLLVFITFWILYSYLVPISLFVTLEIVKFWQGFVFINCDREMRDPATGEGARCRNSNLNEDLGKIDYIFSDKTGTLTSNEMRLRLIAIKGQPLGDLNKMLEDHSNLQGFPAIKYFSEQMHSAIQAIRHDPKAWSSAISGIGSPKDILSMRDSVSGLRGSLGADAGHFLPYHLMDFWLNLALCHALLVDTSDGDAQYQGPSPDEVALVECARTLGFEFISRSATHTVLNILGEEHAFETLEVMEFSSERQRMSVIVRCPDGSIKLMCKGADAMMLKRLSPDTSPDLLERIQDNLHFFATKGLRTLVIGTRIIPPHVYADWDRRFVEAQGLLADDENCEDKLMNEIESNLEVIGVTAIEDKLQDEVPESIATLIEAGIKVWMITGDKQETAINIAISCRLFQGQDNLLICNSNSRDSAMDRLKELTIRAAAMQDTLDPTQLVIDGKTLTHVLEDDEVERYLAKLGSLCGAVVVCRASPSQKARIVTMMRDFELRLVTDPLKFSLLKRFAKQTRNLQGKMLSIGDGANDVAMIQAADVGIGIAGKEGRQAVNNSDYAITQFRFLTRLLLVHGQVSQYRLSRLIKYSFYKNSCFAGVLFYFQIFNGFSGQTLVDDISAAVYNVIFTSLPILFFSLLDQPCKFETMQRFPRTYNKSRGLSIPIFWKTGVLHAFLDAAICFFIPFLAASPLAERSTIDIFSVGKTIFICMLGVVTSEIMIVARYWTAWFAAVCTLSYVLVYPYVLLSPVVMQSAGVWDMENSGVGVNIMSTPFFWVALITVYTMTFTIRYFERSLKWLFRPDDNMILAELEARQGTVSMKPAKPDPRPIYPIVEDPHAAPAGAAIAESQYTAPLVAVSPTSTPGNLSANGQLYFHDTSDARSRSVSQTGTRDSTQGHTVYPEPMGSDRQVHIIPELSM